jgi:hypothetical protein
MQSECDPHLWTQIETLVKQKLSAPDTAAAITPADYLQPTR